MEEILCSIIAGIFAIFAIIFGVRNRSTRTGTRNRVCNDGSRYNDLISNYQRLERDKERVGKLDKRDDENIKRCADIITRIRRREQETSNKE